MIDTKSWFQRLLTGKRCGPQVEHCSAADNVYHCCVHKTASQWLLRILSEPDTFRYCGLQAFRYFRELPGGVDERKIKDRVFDQPFPEGKIVTPLYIGLENFRSIPKPRLWRGFFVMRDPRDILVSWYFSWKHSHRVMGDIGKQREQLSTMTEAEGLCYGIDELQGNGLFAALRSWSGVPANDPNLMLVRYEDLIDVNQLDHFRKVFAHCDITTPVDALKRILEKNSFRAISKGRERGTEDVSSHLRKGVHGDWKNHFTPAVEQKFRDVTGDLVETLGY